MTQVGTDRETRWTTDGMKPLGDRRRRIRLDVVGSLWGVFEIEREAELVNISRGGALIMSPTPAPVDSTQSIRLTLEGHEVSLDARVRHLRRVTGRAGEAVYRIGLEFLDAPGVLAHALE